MKSFIAAILLFSFQQVFAGSVVVPPMSGAPAGSAFISDLTSSNACYKIPLGGYAVNSSGSSFTVVQHCLPADQGTFPELEPFNQAGWDVANHCTNSAFDWCRTGPGYWPALLSKAAECPKGYVSSGQNCSLSTVVPDKNIDLNSCVGNPINAGVGIKIQKETDVSIGLLSFERTYSSLQAQFLSPAYENRHWTHTYERSLILKDWMGAAATVIAHRSTGRSIYFSLSNGTWSADSDVNVQLTELKDTAGVRVGWRLIDDDEVEEYGAAGVLSAIKRSSGEAVSLSYSDGTVINGGYYVDALGNNTSTVLKSGLLKQVIDSFGRKLVFYYYNTDLMARVTDPDGKTISFAYDEKRNPTSVTYPDSKTRTYVYSESINTSGADLPYALTGIIDENNQRFATWKYDSSGRAISSEHANGVEKVTIAYTSNSNGDVTSSTVTDALNTTRTYSFTNILGVVKSAGVSQPCSSGCGAASVITYDANGNISSQTDFNGNITNYVYDLTRNLETSRTEASGTPKARTVSTTWHSTYRLPTLITEPGRTTSFSYDTSGNLLSKTITDTALSQSRTWAYTYNSLGQVLTADGPRTDVSDVTTYTYYASTSAGNYTMGDLATVTDAMGHVTSITKYDANGKPLSITDSNGIVTTLTYSPRGWLTSKAINGVQTTTYEYDGVGQLTKVIQPDASFLSYTYDAAHRLTDITDNSGNKIHYTLDAMGNRTKEETFDPSNALKQARSRVYDSLNRLQKDVGGTNPTTQITQYTYDNNGNLKTTTDPLNGVTTNSYDPLDRLIQITNPANGVSQQGYDSLDQQTSVTDPRSVVTNYTPNALGDVTQTQSPDSGTANAIYDAAGNVTQKTDARGVVANYTYDALNRLTSITYPANTAENVSFTYDSTANGNKGVGRLTGYSNDGATTTLKYDAYGNVIEQVDLIGSQIYTTSYQYNNANKVSRINYPSGRIVEYSRNSIGKITDVYTKENATAASVLVAGGVQYQPWGPVSGLTFGNTVIQSNVYDLDYRLKELHTNAWPPVDFLFGYDSAGRLVSMEDQNQWFNHYFTYDSISRLTADETYTGTRNYVYDANSNRIQRTWVDALSNTHVMNIGYSSSSNRMTGIDAQTVVYDAVGNLTGVGSKTYQYNSANRWKAYLNGGVTVATMKYNAIGQRTLKVAGDITADHHYSVSNKLLAVGRTKSGTGAVESYEYIYLDDLPIGQVTTVKTNQIVTSQSLYYLHGDQLGTPRVVTDGNGENVWLWSSDGFGETAPITDADEDGIDVAMNLRFAGQYYDSDLGTNYNYFRDYDPSTGRYLQSDPIGLEGGLNTYGYVEGNPISKTDPLGLMGYPMNPHSTSVGGGRGGVVGCAGMYCAQYIQGDPSATGSIGLGGLGGAVLICSPKPKEDPCKPPPGNTSWGVPVPTRAGLFIGGQINPDGSYCLSIGVMGSLPIPSPNGDMGPIELK